jgi:hypothetical protein
LERYGYTTHIREIRSYGKLVGEGVTLIGTDVIRILEETLPAHFGGTPLDYQVLEQEDADGFTRFYLLVHPRLALAAEAQVTTVFLRALRDSSRMADVAQLVWRQMNAIQVRRQAPIVSARGKFSPLHLLRHPPPEP